MKPRNQFRLLASLAAVIGAFAAVAPAAGAETPAPGYSQFAGCPSPKTENPTVTSCLRTDITGGKIKIGNKNVPISKPMTLSGGTELEGANFVYNSKGGLSPTKLEVPGGVIGLTGLDWLVNFLGIEQLKLYAEAQLAGTPQILGPENVRLPIKVHLINPALGNNCYIGSNSNPIVLNLTTGTTSPPPPAQPITGKQPEYSFDPSLIILHANNGVFVDNTFSAPGASGCQLTLFGFIPVGLNSVVNSTSGLPAAAGTNETVQNYNLEIVESALVYP
jgi:hypothetical protein